MPTQVKPPVGGNVNIPLPPIKWDGNVERLKCRAGGRRMRTACKTISASDREPFIAGQLARYLVSERATDMQHAWNLPVNGDIDSVTQFSGLSYQDIAVAHADAFVPICLSIEAGRHTCHPEDSPGRDFYNAAREVFTERVRTGNIPWRRPPRGGSGGGTDRGGSEGPNTGFPGTPGPQAAIGTGAFLALAAVAVFIFASKG